MTTITGLASIVLQNALSQESVSSTSTANQTSASDPASSTDANNASASSDATTVTLGNTTSTPLTYNSSGQLTQSQAEQLIPLIESSAASTISALFSDNTAANTSSLSALFGSTDLQQASSFDNSTLQSLLALGGTSTSTSSSSVQQAVVAALAATQIT